MLISFVIPYHNEPAGMLRQCIASIMALNLAPQDKEIILVDDGSDTEVDGLIPDMLPSVRLIRQTNKGLSVARNRGMEEAKGTYIQFVDSDDALIPSEYEKVIAVLLREQPELLQFGFTRDEAKAHRKKAAQPGERARASSVSSTQCLQDEARACLDSSTRMGSPTPRVIYRGSGAAYMTKHNLRPAAWSYVFRRQALGSQTFQPGILHEDELFTPLLFLRTKRMMGLACEAYYYRKRQGSITSEPDEAHLARRFDDALSIIQQLDCHRQSATGLESEALGRRVAQLTMDYIYNIYTLGGSIAPTCERVRRLRTLGLFPLPLRWYTVKYMLFALFTRIIFPG